MADIFVLKSLDQATTLFSVDDSGNVTAAGVYASTGVDDFGALGIKADVVAESTSAAGVTIDGLLLKDGFLVATDSQGIKLGTGVDDTISHNGTLTTWTHAMGDLLIDNTDTNDQIILRLGTDTTATGIEFRNDSDVVMWKVEPISASAGRLIAPDNSTLILGTGSDLTAVHDGTNTVVTSITGNLVVDSTAATGRIVHRLGTDTSATAYEVRGDADTALFAVSGAGAISAGAGMWTGAPSAMDPATTSHDLFDDFLSLAMDWTVTEDHADCTQAISNALNGVLLLTNKAATDDNAQQIQWAKETFRLTSGKRLWVEFRVRCASGDVSNLDLFLGLAETEDLTGVADSLPANGFGFVKADGAATFVSKSSDNNVDLSGAGGTIVNNTWIKLGLLFSGGASGSATITPYVDGVAGSAIASVTYATMTEVAPIAMVRNGDAVTTQTLELDYVRVKQER